MIIGTFNDQPLHFVRTQGIGEDQLDVVTIGDFPDETFLQGLPRWIQDTSQLSVDEAALTKARAAQA